MMKWMLAAGAAALAIASPVSAEKGGHGGGQHAQKSDRDGGQKQTRSGRGGGDRQARAQRGGENRQMRSARVDRGGDRSHARQVKVAENDRRGRDRGNERAKFQNRQGDNHQGNQGNRQARFENRQGDNHQGNQDRKMRFVDRGDNGVRAGRFDSDRRHGRDERIADLRGDKLFRVRDVDRGVVRFRDVDRDDLFVRRLGYGVGGCPPGLAKKNNGCMPPGQAAKFIGQPLVTATRFGALAPLPRSFGNLFYDDDDYYYRYGGGYVYRVDRDRDFIDGLIPLFGAAMIGRPLSSNFVNSYYQPPYYSAFYPNSPYDCHQYGYGYIYETDCMTGLVEDVIPTYDYGYGVGQIMPASYSYYNVPYAYRSYFADNDDYYYRYAPGAIYQVDRGTALVSAVAALLTGGLTVGQQLPMGYSAYNVPLAYRSSYYDTPDAWYRYDNGYIYAVDPNTRLVRNIAYTIV